MTEYNFQFIKNSAYRIQK